MKKQSFGVKKDIVERLMNYDTCSDDDIDEAAKEITKLRDEREELLRRIEDLEHMMAKHYGLV